MAKKIVLVYEGLVKKKFSSVASANRILKKVCRHDSGAVVKVQGRVVAECSTSYRARR